MHVGKSFGLLEAIFWTRRDIYVHLLLATIPTVLHQCPGFEWVKLPWLPIALIGTAVAFLIGFKNNATYDRMWEARKIWGAIVNASRTWGIMVKDFIAGSNTDDALSKSELYEIHKRIIYRHIGWLTALRHQLRQPRDWETMTDKHNIEYRRYFTVPEQEIALKDELPALLQAEECAYVLGKKNTATHIVALQSKELAALFEKGLLDKYKHVEMENMLKVFYDEQGKCERIKNFPYPRQFATLNRYFVWLFIILIPLGMIQEFEKLGDMYVWLTIPFSVLVSWVFHTMDRIGEATENPFQGGANDVPITSLSRTIEIDLREMLDETDLPTPIQPINKILM
jgi:ion channel-forming bestrophin family protein